jgi:hypothetical protein
MYSSYSITTSALEGSGQRNDPAGLHSGKGPPGTHWTGGWVGPRAVLLYNKHKKYKMTLADIGDTVTRTKGTVNRDQDSHKDFIFFYSFLSILPSYGATAQFGPCPPPLKFLNHTESGTR